VSVVLKFLCVMYDKEYTHGLYLLLCPADCSGEQNCRVFLHSDLFKRFKNVFTVSGDMQRNVILHLLKFCDHQTAVYVTALKISHIKRIFNHSIKLFCKQYILYSVLV